MIERGIVRKIEEAQTQGWKQRVLIRFLDIGFRLAKACGLTDVIPDELRIPSAEEGEKLWSFQVERSIKLGFHAELGMSEDDYRVTTPAFQPQFPRFKGRFDVPILVDPRVSAQRQLELYRIDTPNLTSSELAQISILERNKLKDPDKPYQIWVRLDPKASKNRGLFVDFRRIKDLDWDEQPLTVLEGLAVLREFKEDIQKLDLLNSWLQKNLFLVIDRRELRVEDYRPDFRSWHILTKGKT